MLIYQLKLEIKQNKLDEFVKSMHSFLPKICSQKGCLDFRAYQDKAVLSLAETISDVKGKLFIQKIEGRLTVGKLLSADQINKLKLYDMHPKKQGRKHGKKQIAAGHSIEKRGDKKRFDN